MYKYMADIPEKCLEFKPRSYVCKRALLPPQIDGRLDKPFWDAAEWSEEFEDIEWNSVRPAPYHRTRMKMLWDDEALYIGAYLEEDKIWGTLTERDCVIFNDNDFEIFIDPDSDTHAYFEFEMNALNTIWDLLLVKPYRDERNKVFNGLDIHGIKTAVHIDGVINDPTKISENKGWSVEVMMPWTTLKEGNGNKIPVPGDYWRIDFSRVEWRTEVRDGKYAKVINPETGIRYPEDNWIWSPIGLVNMHMPELWGFLWFTDGSVDESKFVIPKNEYLKWELRKLYYMERNYFKKHGKFCSDFRELCGDETPAIDPVIETTSNTYEAHIPAADGGRVYIRHDGLVYVSEK